MHANRGWFPGYYTPVSGYESASGRAWWESSNGPDRHDRYAGPDIAHISRARRIITLRAFEIRLSRPAPSLAQSAQEHFSMMNGAINGKMLNVRLNSGTVEVEQIPEEMYRKYLGGYGIGARLMFDRIPAGADPLGPGQRARAVPGPAHRHAVLRHPLPGRRPSRRRRAAGATPTAAATSGRSSRTPAGTASCSTRSASKPVYIHIEDDKVEIKDAGDLWGMQAIDVEMKLKERHGKKASVACIGPAGREAVAAWPASATSAGAWRRAAASAR